MGSWTPPSELWVPNTIIAAETEGTVLSMGGPSLGTLWLITNVVVNFQVVTTPPGIWQALEAGSTTIMLTVTSPGSFDSFQLDCGIALQAGETLSLRWASGDAHVNLTYWTGPNFEGPV